jgi:CheY-like chemotaxis protein
MKKIDYGDIKILIAIENPMVSKGLQNVLHHEGYPRPTGADSHAMLLEALNEQSFDVIVSATEMGADFIPPTLQKLRQGLLKHHPLPILIELLVSSEGDYIRKVINSGPDDLLQLPVSPGQLLTRLATLAEQPRKPYVVTSDYVGPDRRSANRPDTPPMPLLQVPNLMALKIKRTPEEVMAEEIRASADKIRQMRLERFAFELQWLLRAIRQLFQPEQNDADKLQTFCERIKTLLSQLPKLLPEEILPVIAPQTERLTLGANILLKNGFSADATVLQGLAGLVTKVSGVLIASLSPEILDLTGRGKSPDSE